MVYDPFASESKNSNPTLAASVGSKRPRNDDADPPELQPHPQSSSQLSILGIPPPLDDRVKVILEFIVPITARFDNYEVEAKLGCLYDKANHNRAVENLPLLTESPLRPDMNDVVNFESTVPEKVFKALNNILNDRVRKSATGNPADRVTYTRTRESNLQYDSGIREVRTLEKNANGEEKYVHTRFERKSNKHHLNLIMPGHQFDVRLTLAQETIVDKPDRLHPTRERVKERLSYKYKRLSIDITTARVYDLVVESGGVKRSAKKNVSYEVEIEIDPKVNIHNLAKKYLDGQDHGELIRIIIDLVETVRIIADIASSNNV